MRLTRDERRVIVADLAEQGMSTRAIAPVVGVDQKTISNDMRAMPREESSSPAPVPTFDVRSSERSVQKSPLAPVAGPTEDLSTSLELVRELRFADLGVADVE